MLLHTFKDVPYLTATPTPISFNAFLSTCIRSKHACLVSQLFANLFQKHGVAPDAVSYDVLIKVLCLSGKSSKAFKTLKEMVEGKEGKLDETEELWKEMLGKGCTPDLTAYIVKVMHQVLNGKLDEVLELIHEMESAGVKPDTITYNYLITCYCMMSSLTMLRRSGCLKDSMMQNKVPDFQTMRLLVEGLVKGSKVEEEVFRNVILKTEPPENFALQAVQEAIKPQRQTVLVQDENQSLENALRTLLQELVSAAVQSSERMMQYGQSIDGGENIRGQIPCLLDIVLYLCERGHVEGGMIFQLLEDLTEMSTMKDCKEVFAYIESKQDILGKQELFGRGKLVMLRTCNQLLRRLSKANDVVFCGRILMFLAHFFPLSERSAVNIKGVFNTSNETKYEKDAPVGVAVDFNFYKTFWSLQVVLDTFEAQPLCDDDGNVNTLEQEEATFSIKYLTSSKLMGLELKDPSFRRHILVQCLILFDYLKAPGKNDKDGPLESMKEEIKTCEERVKKLLEIIPPKGKEFLESIEHILEREKNWNALTDPQRVRMPSVTDYWKPLADDMDDSAGIEAEFHHKNNRVYCWKGLRFSARQDLEGFSRFTDHGIEGVVPPELLPPDVRSKFHAKPSEKTKRAKKEEVKGAAAQPDDNQVSTPAVETDGGGNGAELEDGVAPMDSDAAAVEESQKQSPEMDSGHEAGQSEAETEAEAENRSDIKVEAVTGVAREVNPDADPNSLSKDSHGGDRENP
ncbi:putative THO complex subunit 1 [Cocos nucifera]|uniref:Putative THO complex subunit 1 n=1 Tax=Cocos nucifera TaxID=13894 RepID=A0A8K0N9C1_COCNU|nr:putative THO complex subunit 1 [Cocos nucifera]